LKRGSKSPRGFDEVFRRAGVRIVRLPYRAPRANSVAERFVGIARRECLDHLLIFGRRHLERVLTAFLEHYHRARPHQGLEQQLPRPPAEARPVAGGELGRDDPSEASSTRTAAPPDQLPPAFNRP